MRRLILASAVAACICSHSVAEIPRTPDHTLLWNNFTTATTVDSFVVVTANDGLEVLKFEPSTSLYRPVTRLFTTSKARERKVYGPLLVVRTYDDLIQFFDLAHLPEIRQLGSVDLGVSYTDFAYRSQSLYVTCGFRGVWRFRVENYESALFADSSMLGIHCVKVDVAGSDLMVLDDYNGILRYQLSSTGFGQFRDYAFIPFVARSMVRRDSTLTIVAGEEQVWIAEYHADGTTQLDSINLLFPVRTAYITDTMILCLAEIGNLAATINRRNYSVSYQTLKGQLDLDRQGSLRVSNGRTDLVIPGLSDLLTYRLDDFSFNTTPTTGLDRPGPITSLVMGNGMLFTAGESNPLDEYRLESDGQPTFDTSYFPGLSGVRAIDRNGDTLFAYYPSLKQALILQQSGDTLVLEGSIPLGTDDVDFIRYDRQPNDSMSALFAVRGSEVDVWGIPDSGGVTLTSSIRLFGQVAKVVIADSFVVLTTNKGLWVYRLFPDLTLAFRNRINLIDQANEIRWFGGRLLVFIGNDLMIYRIRSMGDIVQDTLVHIPTSVYNSVVVGGRMFTVGQFGITIFDVSGNVPIPLESGGRAGSLIAADHGIVAISDGSSINLFNVRGDMTGVTIAEPMAATNLHLEDNFPNPFNAVTTIGYTLRAPTHVQLEVLNILGESVTTLVDDTRMAGRYLVAWDGTNRRGQLVATGVYFYRLQTDTQREVRKMLLLK